MNAIKLSDRCRFKEVFKKSVNVNIPSGRCILFSNELQIEGAEKMVEKI